MPYLKRTLSRSEMRAHLDCARRLRASGVRIDIPELWESTSRRPPEARLDMMQTGEAFIIETGSGVAYVLEVTLVNQSPRPIYPLEVELRLPWEDRFFHWVEPQTITHRHRKKADTTCEIYRIPGRRGLELDYGEVINHVVVADGSIIPVGRPITGKLVAFGNCSLPDLPTGNVVNVNLFITGSDRSRYMQEISMLVDRLLVKPQPFVRKTNLRGQPLPLKPAPANANRKGI